MKNKLHYKTPEEVSALGLDGGAGLSSVSRLKMLSVKNFKCAKCPNPAWKLADTGLCVDCTRSGETPKHEIELRCEPLSMMYGVNVRYLNQHEQSRSYTYVVDASINLYLGDTVVVPVGKEGGMIVARVTEVLPEPELKEGIAYHWVIQKVDFTLYNALLGGKS